MFGLCVPLLVLTLVSCDTGQRARGETAETDHVVLVHGLAGGPATMWLLGKRLRDEGYRVTAVRYPSRAMPISEQVVHLMNNLDSAIETAHFLRHGRFRRETAPTTGLSLQPSLVTAPERANGSSSAQSASVPVEQQ